MDLALPRRDPEWPAARFGTGARCSEACRSVEDPGCRVGFDVPAVFDESAGWLVAFGLGDLATGVAASGSVRAAGDAEAAGFGRRLRVRGSAVAAGATGVAAAGFGRRLGVRGSAVATSTTGAGGAAAAGSLGG
jgi:hypothetical protein